MATEAKEKGRGRGKDGKGKKGDREGRGEEVGSIVHVQ